MDFVVEDLEGGVVRVSGELDLANAAQLDQRLGEEDCPVLLDLRNVSFMDGSALRVLLQHRDRCVEQGKELRIVAVSSAVRRVLELSDLDALMSAGFN